MTGNKHILTITETMLGGSFPAGQFLLNSYSDLFRIGQKC